MFLEEAGGCAMGGLAAKQGWQGAAERTFG